jgi:hypothetical protein
MSTALTLNQHIAQHVPDIGSGAYKLLLMRMAALQLEPAQVRRIEPGVFDALAGACALCESKDRCEQEFTVAGEVRRGWVNYCCNTATLRALAPLLWFGKAGKMSI